MASPAQVNVNPTIGALEIGVIISSFLLGVVTIQTYIYFRRFPKDPKTTKVLVGVIWLFELGQSICAAQTLYVVTVSRYGDLTSLIHTPSSLNASILFSGFIAPLAQTYFAFRIWKLSKSPFIPCLCIALAFLRLLGSVVAAVQAFKMTTIIEYELQWKWLLTCILAVGASVDVIIALTLVFNLKNQRENAFASTIKVVDKLIAWTIQTGALTSIGGVAMLILFLAMPHNFIWLCIFMFLSRHAMNMSHYILYSLNSRLVLREIQDSIVEFRSGPMATGSSGSSRPEIYLHNGNNLELDKVNNRRPVFQGLGNSSKIQEGQLELDSFNKVMLEASWSLKRATGTATKDWNDLVEIVQAVEGREL
ncbi:hypothetical protein EV359DRAFT_68620 [Lentinula novae-zelandiae]|nr:hypothetical protein EV359DRAFT_68620 [Lentinula novae-zelandiae]